MATPPRTSALIRGLCRMFAAFMCIQCDLVSDEPQFSKNNMRQISQTRSANGQETTLFVDVTESGSILQVVITKLPDTPKIKYDDVRLQGFDDKGDVVQIKKAIPKEEYYNEVTVAATSAAGLYIVVVGKGQKLARVEMLRDKTKQSLAFPAGK